MEIVAQIAERVMSNVEKVIIGKHDVVELTLLALLCQGHLLIEDVPGTGKTILARAVARSIGCTFRRIQFTPDMLPSDVTGVSVFNQKTTEFEFRPGPVFAQIVLADEINRATPKTQSALLEAMDERQVTVDGYTYIMEKPFMVLATQNPIEYEGTFPLPEAQLDRFLISLTMGYPDFEDEVLILEREEHEDPLGKIEPVVSPADILALQHLVKSIGVVRSLKEYIVRLLAATRNHPDVLLGVSPRGGVALQRAAQAMALLNHRDFVTPDDIKTVAPGVLTHRMITHEPSRAVKETVVETILSSVSVPIS